MKDKYYKIGANIVFIALCASTLLLTNHCKKLKVNIDYYKLVNEANEGIAQEIMNEKLTEFYQNEGKTIDSSFQVFSFNEQVETSLSSISDSGKYLVVRISKEDCNACVDSLYKVLQESLKMVDSKRVILITDETNARKVIVYQRVHGVSYRVYGVGKGDFQISFETKTPYLFILDGSLTVQMLHQFNPRNPSITKNYLEIIAGRYLSLGNP